MKGYLPNFFLCNSKYLPDMSLSLVPSSVNEEFIDHPSAVSSFSSRSKRDTSSLSKRKTLYSNSCGRGVELHAASMLDNAITAASCFIFFIVIRFNDSKDV